MLKRITYVSRFAEAVFEQQRLVENMMCAIERTLQHEIKS